MASSNGKKFELGSTSENQWECDIVSTAHPKVQSRVEKWLSQVEDQQLQKIENPRIPVEIIFQIVELLLNDKDECTAVCVAITGRAYYKFFRSVYPKPVLLVSRPPCSYNPTEFPPSLAKLLNDCPKEWDLIRRTRDYYSIRSTQGRTVGELILPNPFGMGTDWYLAAVRQFLKHVEEAAPDVSTVGSNLMQYVPVSIPGFSVIGLTVSTFTSTGLPVRLVNMPSSSDIRPWLHGIPYPAVTSTGYIMPGQTMLGQTLDQDQLRENLRMTNLAVKNQYARTTQMQKSSLWNLMEKYIQKRIPDRDSSGNVLKKTRRMCFWEAIVHASKQDWEQYFLLVDDGLEVLKGNL
ncbi:hypothetical protein ACHAPF_007493 [Botrytis cinerea]